MRIKYSHNSNSSNSSSDWDNIERKAESFRLAPRISWDNFLDRFEWKQGQHITVIGMTGSGKTTLINQLSLMAPYVITFGTKPYDNVLEQLISEHGFVRMESWQELPLKEYPRRIIWPEDISLDKFAERKAVYEEALLKAYNARGWTISIDEARMFSGERNPFFGLGPAMIQILTQGRSSGVTLIAGSQRPRWIPLEFMTESTHLFTARTEFVEDLNRLTEMRYNKKATIKRIVPYLDDFEFLYVSKKSDQCYRITSPSL